ncbi:MAG TPA: serine protease [Actinomycetota bacterium]|nr:serine protease [Actinomycetota bacterium]
MDQRCPSRRMRRLRAITLVLLVVAALVPSTGASAAPSWAPAGTAPIHPGVQVVTAGGQCTSNFIFFDADDVFIGQAAHCSTAGGPTDVNGCTTPSLPLGTEVQVGGATHPGTLVYNSWLTMQQIGETDPNICAYNDFALVRLHPEDAAKVNPSIPHWGGPNGINTTGTGVFNYLYSYGNSSLRLGLTALSPKIGFSGGDRGDGWSTVAYALTPGIPGDSGSAVLDWSGRALGVLSTLEVGIPSLVSNGVGNLNKELEYLRANVAELKGVELALGTVPFTPNRLPLALW